MPTPSHSKTTASTKQNQSGSYFATYRVLDPSTGQWTTSDPAMSPWSKLQDYVGSDPTSASDPSGLAAVVVVGGVALTAAQAIAIIGAVAFAICLWEGTCAEVISDALKKAGKALDDICRPTPAPAPSPDPKPSTGSGVAKATAIAMGATAAAEYVAKVGIEAAKRVCIELYDKYKSYDCRKCKSPMSLAEATGNIASCLTKAAYRGHYLGLGCDWILEGSISRGSEGAAEGHMTQMMDHYRTAATCMAYVAANS